MKETNKSPYLISLLAVFGVAALFFVVINRKVLPVVEVLA